MPFDVATFTGVYFLNNIEKMLNKEQIQLKSEINEFITSKRYGFFGVIGGGGVGKTYAVCQSIDVSKAIFLGATNKVCNVLKKELSNNGYLDVKVKTIDSFFGFKIKKDHNNRNVTTYKIPAIDSIPDIIVIDEVSLINNSHFNNLIKLKGKRKFILIGDPLQIPPIEDEFLRDDLGFKTSKIFNELDTKFELTIQNRQNVNSDLFNLINGFRSNMHIKIPFEKMVEVKNNGFDILYFNDYNSKDLRKLIRDSNPIAVCYKNLSCLSFSWLIGSTKANDLGYKVNNLNEGDTVFFDSFYKDDKQTFYTSDIVKIIEIKDFEEDSIIIEDYEIKYNYKVMTVKYGTQLINIKVTNGYKESIYPIYYRKNFIADKFKKIITEERDKPITNNKKIGVFNTKLSKLNTAYSDLMLSFAKLKKPFAITCHKAQGSTYKDVIIPIYDYYNRHHQDVNQLLYVAMSRASERIIFVNRKSNFKDNSNRYSFTELERTCIASKQDYKCKICHTEILDNRLFDLDHEIPLKMNGTNSESNLQALCKDCHKEKTAQEKILIENYNK